MYCRKCYTKLDGADFNRCPRCARTFDPADRRTHLARRFPDKLRIIWHITATTFVCLIAAYVVALFQMAGASGH